MAEMSVINVRQMAAKCQFSPSRFYELIAAGIFPAPLIHPSSKRPMYVRELQEKCLEVCRTGIGVNGVPVLFNKKPTRGRKQPPRPVAADNSVVAEVVASLKGLNISTTPRAVEDALATLFPQGHAGMEMGPLIVKIHEHLSRKQQ